MGTPRFLTAAALATMCLLEAQQPKAKPAEEKPKLGDNSAGSRGQPAHIIPLRDPEGDTIQPGDRRALPFSVSQTCGGDCHDVAAVGRGWHFNATASLVNSAGVPAAGLGLKMGHVPSVTTATGSRGCWWIAKPPRRFHFPTAPGREPIGRSRWA